ncbi:MAG: hypothetical protein L6R42_003509 [Xanthoria sp. 1 TBL-2021]|nr:MAG: hypothetical protein L6R42_003509 [Xanthoria sp. 1 TBL-2021]
MTQAFDMSTESSATGLKALTSLSSPLPSSPPSSCFDTNNARESDDISLVKSVQESSTLDLMVRSPGDLASRDPVSQPDWTDFNAEAGPAAAFEELVESENGAGASLPSPEAKTKTPCDQSSPRNDPVSTDHTGPMEAVTTEQGIPASSADIASPWQPNDPVSTDHTGPMEAVTTEQGIPVSSADIAPPSQPNNPVSTDHTGPMEVVTTEHVIPASSADIAPPSQLPNNPVSTDHTGPMEAVTTEQGIPASSADVAPSSQLPNSPVSIDRTEPTEAVTVEQGTSPSSANAASTSHLPNDPVGQDYTGSAEAATIDQGRPASSPNLCNANEDYADGTYELDPIQDERPASPKPDHREAGCESLNADGVNAAAPPCVPSSKALVDSGTPSSKDHAQQDAPAASGGGPRSTSVSNVAPLSHTQRRRKKQAAFKVPRGLEEAPSSTSGIQSKRKRSPSSEEGSSKCDPICLDVSDKEDKSTRSKRPTDDRNHAGQASPKLLARQQVIGPRPKRQRRQKPNYIHLTNIEISNGFEHLDKE